MTTNDNIIGLLRIWVKWKKTLLQLCIAAGVISALASWFLLKNYYKSTTIFYAASSDAQKSDKLFGVTGEPIYYFGQPEDIDRILSVAESGELRDYLTQRFELYKRYQFDSTTQKSRHDFVEHFKELYSIEKNKLDAIELSIEDVEPLFAQKITLAAREYIDSRVANLLKVNQQKIIQNFEASLNIQAKETRELEDSLRQLRTRYGILNTETQSEIVTNLSAIAQARLARISAQVKALEREPRANQDTIIMLRSLAKGLENELSTLNQSNISTMNKGMSLVFLLTQIHIQKSKQMGYDAVRLEQLRSAARSAVSTIYVIEEPRTPEIKSRPKRSMLVIAAILATFIFTTIAIIALETYRKIDWNQLKDANVE